MTYTPTNWVDGATPLNRANMMNIENGIAAAASRGVVYNAITAPATGTATVEASADIIIPGSAAAFDGSGVFWDVFLPFVAHSVQATYVFVCLFDGGSSVGKIGAVYCGGAGGPGQSFRGGLFNAPSAGTHTYSIRLYANVAGTFTVTAAGSGAGNYMPAYLRGAYS